MDNNLQIKETVVKIIGEISQYSISPSFDLEKALKELGMDSLEIMILLSELEKEFNIIIPAEDFLPVNFGNINTIIDYIKGRTSS